MPTISPQSPDHEAANGSWVLGERLLIGGLTALIVARPLLANNDPGRLRLTSGGGPLLLNALSYLLLLAWGIWRIKARRALERGPGAIVVFGLLAVGALAFASAAGPDRYQRPGWFIGWDWLSIATLCFLTWQLASTPAIARGLTAVLIATAACLSSQALYQSVCSEIGLPTTEAALPPASSMPLVGDDEFGLNIDQPPPPRDHFRATFDQPDTLACFLILVLPVAILWVVEGWRRRGKGRLAILAGLTIALAAIFASLAWISHSEDQPHLAVLQFIQQFPWLGGGPGNLSRMTGMRFAQPSSYWLGIAATTGLAALGVLLLTLLVAILLSYRRTGLISAETNQDDNRRTAWEFYFGGVAGLLLGMMLATGDIPAESAASEILRLGVVGACRAVIWVLAFALLEKLIVDSRKSALALLVGMVLVALAGFFTDALSSPALLQTFWLTAIIGLAGSNGRNNWSPASLPYAIAAVSLAIALLGANLMHVGVPGLRTAFSVRSARQTSQIYPHLRWQTTSPGESQRPAMEKAAGYLDSTILQTLRQAVEVDSKNSALLLELARWEREHWTYLFRLKEKDAAKSEANEFLNVLPEKAAALDPHNLGTALSAYTSEFEIAGAGASPNKEQLARLDRSIVEIAAKQPQREIHLRHGVVLLVLSSHAPPTEERLAWLDSHIAAIADMEVKREVDLRYRVVLMLLAIRTPPTKEQLAWLDKNIAGIVKLEPKREVGLRYRVVSLLLSGDNKKATASWFQRLASRGSNEALETWGKKLFRLNAEPGFPHGRMSDDQRSRLKLRILNAKEMPSRELIRLMIGAE